MREITYTQALSEALQEEVARDEAVFSIGEDIGPVFGLGICGAGPRRDPAA